MGNLVPTILHAVADLSRVRAARQFEEASQVPAVAQAARLDTILRRNGGTEFGRKHGFSSIRTAAEYARAVPLMQPLELEPWVQRQMAGERNILTADAPEYYVLTSGSTGVPRHIPITPSYRQEFQVTVQVALWNLRRRFPEAFHGRALYFVGSRRLGVAPDGHALGTMSGYNYAAMPSLVRAIYAWPYELFEVPHLPTRGFLSLLLACIGEPTIIAGIFPAPIVYLLRRLANETTALARALHDGRLPAELELTPAQRDDFTRRLGGRRLDLAQRLDRAGAAPEDARASIAWPSLRLVYCWTTSTAGLYVPELKRRLGPGVAVRDAIFSASEGWCSIPMGEERPGGALAITSHYYEFIEESAYLRGETKALGAHELEDGRRYLIVLTTSAGLYRFVLGDVVEVVGFHGRTPRIGFVRRLGGISNLVGEKLEENFVSEAIARTLAQSGLDATYFVLVPTATPTRIGYTLLLEPAPASPPLPADFAHRADLALQQLSTDYRIHRAGTVLAPMDLRVLATGTYERVRQEKVTAGNAEAQLKIAHLVAGPEVLAPPLRDLFGA